MTYWATLWYAGVIVLQMGELSANDCTDLISVMITDIEASYLDTTTLQELQTSPFPTNQFSVSCEETYLLRQE